MEITCTTYLLKLLIILHITLSLSSFTNVSKEVTEGTYEAKFDKEKTRVNGEHSFLSVSCRQTVLSHWQIAPPVGCHEYHHCLGFLSVSRTGWPAM